MAQNSYNDVPYPSLPVRGSHPSHLATVARLFGMTPPPPSQCRVLELGCASGGNLLPLAVDFPESQFVGIDLSARQIDTGRATIEQLGLQNIDLHALDLNDVRDDLGEFDYIICHGVFSWVPHPVQDKILEIGYRHLSPGGVMFVSYNTYPGWHMRGVVRDMMAFHVADLSGAETKIDQARALLDFLTESAAPANETYRQLLRDEAEILKTRDDAYLYHEHLEDVNEPFYFHQFVERTSEAKLQYLGDADLPSMLPQGLDEQAAALMKQVSMLQQEQYLDFLSNRMFRCSLLCHQEVSLERKLDSSRLTTCDIGLEESLDLPPLSLGEATPLTCETSIGRIKVESPLTRAALHVLQDALPGCVPFATLLEKSLLLVENSGLPSSEEQHRLLASDMLTLYLQRLVRVWDGAPSCVSQASERPLATSLARWQTGQGNVVFNRRHEALRLSDLERHLLARLDGHSDRFALQSVLAEGIRQGRLEVRQEGVPHAQLSDEALSQIVDRTLLSLAQKALLVS